MQGNNAGVGSLETCTILPLRCLSCKRGGKASIAKSWRSQQKYCAWGMPVEEGASLIISPGNKD